MLLVTSGDCNQVEHIQKIQTCTHDLSITKRCAKGLGERHNNWCHRSRYWRPDHFERCCSRPVSTVLLKYIKSVPKESSIWVRRWKHQFIPIVLWCRPIILNSRLKNKAVDKILASNTVVLNHDNVRPFICSSVHPSVRISGDMNPKLGLYIWLVAQHIQYVAHHNRGTLTCFTFESRSKVFFFFHLKPHNQDNQSKSFECGTYI